jgi:hypothetical protein
MDQNISQRLRPKLANMVEKKHVVFTLVLLFALTSLGHSQTKAKRSPVSTIDPEAMRLLSSMSDFLTGLDQFSYHVVNMREDMVKPGHRVDYETASRVTVDRPNKVKAVREGHLVDQEIYYNGRSLVVFSPGHKIYSSVDVPDNINATLKFAREELGIGYPAADLIYSGAFPLLTKRVRSARVIGKEMIAGHRCDHLLFMLPDVDFQIWIVDRGDPLPFKYIVTDTRTRQLLSVVAVLDSWNLSPHIESSQFEFVPPDGSRAVPFRTAKGRTIIPKTKQ